MLTPRLVSNAKEVTQRKKNSPSLLHDVSRISIFTISVNPKLVQTLKKKTDTAKSNVTVTTVTTNLVSNIKKHATC